MTKRVSRDAKKIRKKLNFKKSLEAIREDEPNEKLRSEHQSHASGGIVRKKSDEQAEEAARYRKSKTPEMFVSNEDGPEDIPARLIAEDENIEESESDCNSQEDDSSSSDFPEEISSDSESGVDFDEISADDEVDLTGLRKKKEGFKINMNRIRLDDGIAFVTKFTHVFRKIQSIDFGDNKLEAEDVEEFGQTLKDNRFVQNVSMKKKGVSRHTQAMLEREIEKNKQIMAVTSNI